MMRSHPKETFQHEGRRPCLLAQISWYLIGYHLLLWERGKVRLVSSAFIDLPLTSILPCIWNSTSRICRNFFGSWVNIHGNIELMDYRCVFYAFILFSRDLWLSRPLFFSFPFLYVYLFAYPSRGIPLMVLLKKNIEFILVWEVLFI